MSMVCICFSSFMFNCTMFIDNSHSSIFIIHAIIVASSSFVSPPNGSIFWILFYHLDGNKKVKNASHMIWEPFSLNMSLFWIYPWPLTMLDILSIFPFFFLLTLVSLMIFIM
jgi:hypothetical protein